MSATVLALLTALSGCATSAPTAVEPPTLPDGIRVEVLQGRTDYSSGTLVIRVINASKTDLDLSRASLEAAGFADPAVWERGTTVVAGTTVDLRAPVPGPDCTERPGDPEVTLTVGADDATDVVDATDPLGTLDRLHASACISVLVDMIVRIDVTVPEIDGAGAGSVAVLPLTLTPTGADGTVEIGDIRSTPLLRPAPTDDGQGENWPVSLVVDAASDPTEIAMRIVPARCDPHAIAEDKVGTVLVFPVTFADGTTGDYRLVPPDDVREQLLDFVREHCNLD
ncbi:hypothetical protein IWX78_002361 [Mycetocola sp. CAN_C7]|uniref:hypothetical protein n=1 Tax=Mycetocola sp. CAN_C7 TaxID=2787724 RepID=UPI0018CBC086